MIKGIPILFLRGGLELLTEGKVNNPPRGVDGRRHRKASRIGSGRASVRGRDLGWSHAVIEVIGLGLPVASVSGQVKILPMP